MAPPARRSVSTFMVSAAVLTAGVSLAGCATTPAASSHAATVVMPSGWQQPGPAVPRDAAALAQWWRQFNDPTLDQLIAEALRANPDVRTAVSRIAESRARFSGERANLLPSVNGSVSGRGSRVQNRDTGVTTRSESYSAGVDASWEIDLFGREANTVSAARADLAQSEENLRNVQASLAAEVATAYVGYRSTAAQLSVVQRSLATRTETLQIAQWREQAGLTSALDTQQAISSLEQSRASIPSLQQSLEQSRNQLALLCGRTPGGVDALLAGEAPLPSAPAQIAIGIPADTLRQRPDIRAAEQALEAAAARRRAAERQRFPSLSLSGSIGVDALRAGKLFSPADTTSSLVGSLTAPIFDAGRIRQAIKVQGAVEEQAFISYESTVLTALSEVENALISERRTAERITVLERATAAAREAATLAEQQYEAGQVDLLTVLDAQRSLLSLEQQQVSTSADQVNAHIQLYKAVGGGWSNS